MKNCISYFFSILALTTFFSCSKDDSGNEPTPVPEQTMSIKLAASFTTARFNVVEINPEVLIENNKGLVAKYRWTAKVTNQSGVVEEVVVGDTKTLSFIMPKAATYPLELTVTSGELVKKATTTVVVSETGKTYGATALSLIDYVPSPCFNMNNFSFTSKAEVLEEVKTTLNNGEAVPLGTFGGYIVLGFDHTVINTYNKRDFTVQMQMASGSIKYTPASIFVAYDANKNGIADENEWFEIAGSEHHKSTTIKDYEMTYYKPATDKVATPGTKSWQFDTSYLKWTDNKNGTAHLTKTDKWKRYNYYPAWMSNTYTLKGTKLYLPIKDVSDGEGTTFNVGTFEWGYGGIKDPSIDISWAVDKTGKKVHLPGIDFVKVYVSTFAAIGNSDLLTNSLEFVQDLNL
ncbi:hypothetical protein [Pedobacter xixiisoli]|uniref:PKD-like domain-containing protein n=1 Tax=Pedobacter xixiisoli TaxID=1476464 RepID=A0A286A0C9_9SPHI|nr:hypothetical protein [Pedobacter xixiisoli]SOD15321.1 hypothetical protein SAMN06297358_2308 [Pedobacter xixiisoli]